MSCTWPACAPCPRRPKTRCAPPSRWPWMQRRRTSAARSSSSSRSRSPTCTPNRAIAGAEVAQRSGFRSILSVPLLHQGRAIGTIGVARREPGRFADSAVALLQTFARQAVIAIENVRLFNETQEALERQTATAEVLQVISSSMADAQPVFEKILDSCQPPVRGRREQRITLAGRRWPGAPGRSFDARERLRRRLKRCVSPSPLAVDAAAQAIADRRQRRAALSRRAANGPDVPADCANAGANERQLLACICRAAAVGGPRHRHASRAHRHAAGRASADKEIDAAARPSPTRR